MEGSRNGKYKVVSNRFVLREAIDMPWLYHGIAACTFSTLASYLQASGRVLRYTPLWDHVIWQDHGSNIHRWGFINEDREWEIGKGNQQHYSERKEAGERAKDAGEVEPIVCPKCDGCRTHGTQCPHCGHVHKMTTRHVRQEDGTLKLVRGRFFKRSPEKTLDTFITKSIYMHRAMCRKNYAIRKNKTLRDVAINAVNAAEREGIIGTVGDALESLKKRSKGGHADDNFMAKFFPSEG